MGLRLQVRDRDVRGGTVRGAGVQGSGIARNFRQGVRQSVAFLGLSLTDKNIGTSARFYA